MNSSTDQKQTPSEYQANLELLMQVPLFIGLPVEPLKVLAYLCKRETFRPGDILFHQFEIDPNAYFIVEGETSLIDEQRGGDEYGSLAEPGFFGGMSLFCDIKRLFTLKAKTKVVCLILSREKFQRTVERFPEIHVKIFKSILMCVYEWEEKVVREHLSKCPPCRQWAGVSLI